MPSERDKTSENPYEASRSPCMPVPPEPSLAFARFVALILWMMGGSWGLFQICYQFSRFDEAPIQAAVSIATALAIAAVLFGLGVWGLRGIR